ncbi:MAG: hypothetical protein ABIN89_22795 [Chitinophagaceae bacterium]
MRKNLLHKSLLFFYFLVQLIDCQAQSTFQYESSINNVKLPGFYKILLKPAILSKCKNELNDIRILDDKSKQVPYILKSDQPEFQGKNFIELPILAVKKEADKQTHIVIQNQLHKTINELLLIIKNADAERTVAISGSDDQKQWFVIRENITLSNLYVQEQDRFIQSLSFPNSSYNFFEIVINGKDLLPVNIVKVGVYEGLNRVGSYLDIPDPVILQTDSSNKISYVHLEFNDRYILNKLKLEILGPKFFRRRMSMQETNGRIGTNIGAYTISSDVDPSYTINSKAKKLLLEIENEDSPPLKIRSAKAYQLNKYLLTYLEPDIKYKLAFGDSTTGAPRYDLEFFKDSIHNAATEINIGSIIKINYEKPDSKQNKGKNMLVLWIIIIAVLALLLMLTLRMTKEVSGKNKM